MRFRPGSRAARLLAAGAWLGLAASAHASGLANPLADPGTYDFAPPAPVKGGEVSQSFGSGGMRSTSIRLDTGGLLGGSTRAFLALGAGQGPQFHGAPIVKGNSIALGVQSEIAPGTTLSLLFVHENDKYRLPGAPLGYGSPAASPVGTPLGAPADEPARHVALEPIPEGLLPAH